MGIDFQKVNFYNRVSGYRASPDDVYLVIRGLRTLDLRLERHEKNTKEIIQFLRKQKKIVKILYPYKKETKDYKNWKKYYKGATGLLGLVIKAKSKNSVFRFCKPSLDLTFLILSLKLEFIFSKSLISF